MGGSWEKLVRSVKVALGTTLVNHTPTDEILLTLSAVVNSRPLTEVSVDPKDPQALTQNIFLNFRSVDATPRGEYSNTDLILRKS
ncbi:unnamed protein product [Allacma fusca]|uniref:Uncharacterized protein n=1 Tax=Allacma fusca TaxID=39272 RepID=A0A8J2K6S7_9HEXA|nr:unnamed protein product [Allacma fusca]